MQITDLKNIYPISKTIAFQLLPVGKTAQNIEELNIIKQNEEIAENYELVKAVADRVHKRFIEEVLSRHLLKIKSDGNGDSLEEYAEAFARPVDKKGSTDSDKKAFTDADKEALLASIAAGMKQSIEDAFMSVRFGDTSFLAALASEKLCKEILPAEKLSEDEARALESIKKYTTFMRRYFETRDRMYRADSDGHTVPNRWCDDNLPIHFANCRKAAALPEEVVAAAAGILSRLSLRLDADSLYEVFSTDYAALIGAQSRIDVYNALIGGFSEEDGTKVQGLNELVNQWNQKQTGKDAVTLPGFGKLKKQILSDHEPLSWLPESFKSDGEMLATLAGLEKQAGLLPSVQETILAAAKADPDRVYVKNKSLNFVSHALFGDWSYLKSAVYESLKSENPIRKREQEKNYAKRIEKLYEKTKSFSFTFLQNAVALFTGKEESGYLSEYIKKALCEPFSLVPEKNAKLHEYLAAMKPDEKIDINEGSREDSARGRIQAWLDLLVDAKDAAKAFATSETLDKDEQFYAAVAEPWYEFSRVLRTTYDMTRNYLTRKPYSTDKLNLSFGNPQLMAGWDKSKIDTNWGVLLRKGAKKYLAILTREAKNIFTDGYLDDPRSEMEMMRVKYINGAFKMLPKVGFSGKYMKANAVPEELIALRESGKPVKDYTPEEVHMMIDHYKTVISKNADWAVFGFRFKDTQEYSSLNEFFTDMDSQCFSITYSGISEDRLMKAVSEARIHLFEITCKGMQEAHHGKPQKYVTILEEVFKGTEEGQPLARIAGNASVYFRKASIDKEQRVIHPKGIAIACKNPDGVKKARVLPYDVIKDRRFTEDRYAFHLPVALNPLANKFGANSLNRSVQEIIRENKDMYVLGINRGEHNLITMVLTAPDGSIVEQRSLNVIDGYDYAAALGRRESERQEDRKNWNAVRDIKNLKKGHLTKAVGEIAKTIRKYRCVVVMENLNQDFKQSRRCYEKGEYEQFERDLIGKLCYMTDKDDTANSLGNALQLATPGDTVEDRTKYKQNGIVFFVSPTFITMTDPVTGFVNRFPTKFKTVHETVAILKKCKGFRYLPEEGTFELSFNYKDVTPDKEAGKDKVWKVYTYGLRNDRENDDELVSVTEKLTELLYEHGIDSEDGHDLLAEVLEQNAEFYKEFLNYLHMAMTNTVFDKKTGEYRLIGCTKANDSTIYDSRFAPEGMPKDPDANAAWNIALKGRMILDNIRNYDPAAKPEKEIDEDGNTVKAKGPRMVVSDAEWLNYVQ